MKLKNALLIPVVVGLVVYGGLKGYIYYKVKDHLDTLATQVGPFVDLSYTGINSSLAGEIGVEGIRVAPRGANQGVDIESLTVRGDGVDFLLDLVAGIKMDPPPEKMHFAFRRMRIPLDADFLQQLNAAENGKGPKPCSLGGIMQHKGLDQIGFDTLVADARVGYRHNPRTGELDFRFDYDIDGVERLHLNMELNGVSQPAAMAMGAMPTMTRMNISYAQVPEYIQAQTGYCAQQQGVTPAQFVDQLLNQGDAYYASNIGFIPGAGLRSVIKRLLSEPTELEINLTPDASVNPMTLAAYKPADIIRMLNMGVSINGQAISDLSFTVPEQGGLFSRLRLPGNDASEGKAPERKRVVRPKAFFMETPVADLHRYIGRDVRLYSNDTEIEKIPKQGILMAIKDNVLDVEQRLHGGKMTVHVPLTHVARVEVLRVK